MTSLILIDMKIIGWLLLIISGVLLIGSVSNLVSVSEQVPGAGYGALSNFLSAKKGALTQKVVIFSVVFVIGLIMVSYTRKKKVK